MLSIGIRVNTNIHCLKSRFGFNLESGEAYRIVKDVNNQKFLNLAGIHYHLGSNIPDPNYYHQASTITCQWISSLKEPSIKYLDFGGGFPVSTNSKYQNSFKFHTIHDYIQAIVKPIKKFKLNHLQLILEPGRYLVDESTIFISQALHTRYHKNKALITINASKNIMPLTQSCDQKILIIPWSGKVQPLNTKHQAIIYGHSCMESDWLAKKADLTNKVHPKNMVIFYTAGAYNITQSNQFSFPRPAIILLEKNKTRLIRKAENFHTLISKDYCNI